MTANLGEPEPTQLGAPTQPRGRIPADTFANRLLLARTLDGLTIRDAAEKCGLNYGSWSNWERGMRPRDILEVAQRIAEVLDINAEWLLFGGPLTPSRPAARLRDTAHYPRRTVRPPGRGPKSYPTREGVRRPHRVTDPSALSSAPPLASNAPMSMVTTGVPG